MYGLILTVLLVDVFVPGKDEALDPIMSYTVEDNDLICSLESTDFESPEWKAAAKDDYEDYICDTITHNTTGICCGTKAHAQTDESY